MRRGGLSGLVPSLISAHPSKGGGWFITLLLGVVGAMLGGWLGGLIFNVNLQGFFNLSSWLLAIGGSVVVLLIYGLMAGCREKK